MAGSFVLMMDPPTATASRGDETGPCTQEGDRVGMLLDLDDGGLLWNCPPRKGAKAPPPL
jgi:hypothetical protein